MIKKCHGCGVILQDTNKKALGYVNNIENNLCQRCFRLKHYGEYQKSLIPMNLDKFINKLNTDKKNIVFIVDFFNINKYTMDIFKNINQEKILVITKSDLIFKSIKSEKIISFIRKYYNVIEKILFVSAYKKNNINELINYLETKNNNIFYFVGLTNSGKSSLINTILQTDNITTSIMPNTTLKNIKVSYKNLLIYDTPGINYENFDYQDINFNKKINTKKFIKPITYQTKENFNLNIENKINIWTNNKNSFTLYCSNELILNKYFKESNATSYNVKKNSDIVIKCIGFINVKKDCIIKTNNDIEIRPSIF